MTVDDASIEIGAYQVHPRLYRTVTDHILPGTGISEKQFWQSLTSLLDEFAGENQELLQMRQTLQKQIDVWYITQRKNGGLKDVSSPQFVKEQTEFLTNIGYIQQDITRDPCVSVQPNVDDEIARVSGPQLVVPVDNARFVLNALNARWGSLFSTVYNSDLFLKSAKAFDAAKGAEVVSYCLRQLDSFVPLQSGSWTVARRVTVEALSGCEALQLIVDNGTRTTLRDSEQFRGFNGSTEVLLCHHDLHFVLVLKDTPFSACNQANIGDILLESALTAILDFEDSVAAVDAEDKSRAYLNWTAVMKGQLEVKLGQDQVRKMNPDKHFRCPRGSRFSISGRVVALVRNVGLHMVTDAVRKGNQPVPEGLLDTMITACAALHDVRNAGSNSKKGCIYIVKPKMHGPEEVSFVCRTFSAVEKFLGLTTGTMKIGIMG